MNAFGVLVFLVLCSFSASEISRRQSDPAKCENSLLQCQRSIQAITKHNPTMDDWMSVCEGADSAFGCMFDHMNQPYCKGYVESGTKQELQMALSDIKQVCAQMGSNGKAIRAQLKRALKMKF